MAADRILRPLNPEQRDAVLHGEGPALVIAGPGSGKTRVIAHRIAHLVEDWGVEPHSIMAVTFTNKAAAHMKDRIADLIEDGADRMWASTFHSMCARILRRNAHLLGYPRSYTIYDQQDAERLTKDILKNMGYEPRDAKYSARKVHSHISSWKNKMISPKNAAIEAEENLTFDDFPQVAASVYSEYQKRLFRAEAMDFDDLLLRTVDLFEQHPDVADSYRARFGHVLIDEYQDTNIPQIEIAGLMSDKDVRNVFAVGDPDQSIYAFRGVHRANIKEFQEVFGSSEKYILDRNYRSGQLILDAANDLISNNTGRDDKNLRSESGDGPRPALRNLPNERSEADFAVEVMDRIHKTQSDDAAVLYRTAAQSRAFEEALIEAQIPYQIVGTKFYDRKEVKDAMAYLKAAVNPNDDMSAKRVVNTPARGIGQKTIATIDSLSTAHDASFLEAAAGCDRDDGLTAAAIKGIDKFLSVLSQTAQAADLGPAAMLQTAMDASGYSEALKEESTDESLERLQNVKELIGQAHKFPTHDEFLEHVSLISDTDEYEESARVTLMTLHSSKGLEFDTVILAGMEEGLFPHSMSMNDPAELEEERRLAYVGMTRAKKILYLTTCARRYLYGHADECTPSRFIKEAGLSAVPARRPASTGQLRTPGYSRRW